LLEQQVWLLGLWQQLQQARRLQLPAAVACPADAVVSCDQQGLKGHAVAVPPLLLLC
jgi:hypothetical protein